jgi:hypothetical protein
MAMDQAAESASSAGSEGLMQLLTGPEVLLVVSAGFLSISVGTFFFGLMLNRLTADDAEA